LVNRTNETFPTFDNDTRDTLLTLVRDRVSWNAGGIDGDGDELALLDGDTDGLADRLGDDEGETEGDTLPLGDVLALGL
jgi:hypothetical protein